ncbi:MAG TPA: YggT family protein [Candidatus Saccharimonadia bacterium]|jgi:YggT family protein
MIWLVALKFVDIFVSVFNILLIARVVSSYLLSPQNPLYAALINLTEPLLVPIRRALPQSGMVDWAPLVAFFVLQGLQYGVHALLGG